MSTVLLLSTYDLGRQPFGLASPAAWLRQAGHEVTCVDLTRTRLDPERIREVSVVGVFLPMHTATRLALPVIDTIRELNPTAHLIAYGLYAPLSEGELRAHGVQTILGPEFEEELTQTVRSSEVRGFGGSVRGAAAGSGAGSGSGSGSKVLPRLVFVAPDRSDLPPLTRYASLETRDGRKVVGYTEASRGCKHRCRHCPIVPVYDGRFRIVGVPIVLADIDAQVGGGATHITFGDPDFFNGPKHAMAIVDALHARHPGLSYDVTIKVEHLLQHRDLLPRLRDTGCAFVTSAVESIDDRIVHLLDKGHTRADFQVVVRECHAAGLPLSPTFVAFTPWTTMTGYCEFLQEIDRLALVPAVAPVQYAIRLLVPQGSRMLELPEMRDRISHYDSRTLTHVWRHQDPAVDALQRDLEALAGSRLNAPRDEFFSRVWEMAHAAAGLTPPDRQPLVSRATVPYLNEPWYC